MVTFLGNFIWYGKECIETRMLHSVQSGVDELKSGEYQNEKITGSCMFKVFAGITDSWPR